MQPQLPALAELAQRLASVYLADWFRLDVFVGHPRLGMRVNEVTYPSHVRVAPLAAAVPHAQRLGIGRLVVCRRVRQVEDARLVPHAAQVAVSDAGGARRDRGDGLLHLALEVRG